MLITYFIGKDLPLIKKTPLSMRSCSTFLIRMGSREEGENAEEIIAKAINLKDKQGQLLRDNI